MIDFKTVWAKLRLPFLLSFVTLFGGSFGYHCLYPNEPWWRLLYMTSITLSTVGYGDIFQIEHSPVATLYTMLLMLAGMGLVLYSVSTITAYVLEGHLGELFLAQSIRRRVAHMKDHFIICGAGETGIHVISEMYHGKHGFIVLEADTTKRDKVRALFPDCCVLIGDATSDELLKEAKIASAHGLVAALSNDKDNLFLTISARMLNPKIKIVSKAIDLTLVGKLKTAGADYVVSPNFIGGMRMASEMLRPHVVTFLDRMLRGKEKAARIEEVVVPQNSSLCGKSLEEAHIYQECGLYIMALKSGETGSDFIYNPPLETRLNEGTILLYIADMEQHKKMHHLFSN
ncbi:MAG: NAD-binding protein [Bdellovibrio sp.]|nr:NAD-binding protein [Bdellovibrio sp.]